jgi:RimJ/RimL family protein N-acetyltransferase
VLEKAGFVCEGILKSNAYKNGNIVDMKMYALIRVQ